MRYPLGFVRPRDMVAGSLVIGLVGGAILGMLHALSTGGAPLVTSVIFATCLGGACFAIGALAAWRQHRVLTFVESWLGESLGSGGDVRVLSHDRLKRVRSEPFHRATLSSTVRGLADGGGGSRLVLEEIDLSTTPPRTLRQTVVDGATCIPAARTCGKVNASSHDSEASVGTIEWVKFTIFGQSSRIAVLGSQMGTITVGDTVARCFSIAGTDSWTDFVD